TKCKTDSDCSDPWGCEDGICGGKKGSKSGHSAWKPKSGGDILSCRQSGVLIGKGGHKCNQDNGADCCVEGKEYPKYTCSPPISSSTPAILTLNDFQSGGDGGAESSCDNKFHSNSESVCALSTGWFNRRKRCGIKVKITASNGRITNAKVVDECDSTAGCD
ncbi:unnamed protein product, partial [Didymodactylos carnosus]